MAANHFACLLLCEKERVKQKEEKNLPEEREKVHMMVFTVS